jgi:hypothetical protein
VLLCAASCCLRCACHAAPAGTNMGATMHSSAAGAGARLQSLFLPTVRSEVLLVCLALCGQAAASQIFELLLRSCPLGMGLVAASQPIHAAAAPDASLLILLHLCGCKPLIVQQAAVLLARMCLWGPMAHAAGGACMRLSLEAIGAFSVA